MFYGDKTVEEMDKYYRLNIDIYPNYPYWLVKECESIQGAFTVYGILLTIAESRQLYSMWCDETHSSSLESYIENATEENIFKLLYPFLKSMLADRARRILKLSKQLDKCGYKPKKNK